MVGAPLHLAVLGTLLAVAAASDVAQRRVPNALVAPLAAAGLAAQWAAGGPRAALLGLLAGAIVLLLLAIPWATGKLGGGDVKLMAATATWLGVAHLLDFLVISAVAGAPVALAAHLSHRVAMARLVRGGLPAEAGALPPPERETVPLAVAVALGALGTLCGGLS